MLHETVEVTIFNQTYRLRSETGKAHVQQIARIVDERMRRISAQITTHDVSKIAILTALNIADEM
jgi:cell division protein ZapA